MLTIELDYRKVLNAFELAHSIPLFLFFTFTIYVIFNFRDLRVFWKYPKSTALFWIPFFGHIGIFKYYNDLQSSMDGIPKILNLMIPDAGKLHYVLRLRYILLYKPEHIVAILTHPKVQYKSFLYEFMQYFNQSFFLFGRPGQPWKDRRKMMMPAMATNVVSSYTPNIYRHTSLLADIFKDKVGETFDATPYVSNCALDMFVDTSFGLNVCTQKTGSDFEHNFDLYMEKYMFRILSIWKIPFFIYRWTKDYRIQQRALKSLYDYLDKLIDLNMVNTQVGDKNFMSHMLELYRDHKVSFDVMKSEVYAFLIAGYDTCNSAADFALLALGMFPELQDKVYAELIAVVGRHRPIEHADLSKLTYTEMFLKEVLRLFPPVPAFMRQNHEEVELDGNVVPKGTTFIVSTVFVHRSPEHWKDPLKFDPMRWTPEEAAKHTKGSYVPFSIGPRTCMGPRLGWINLKMLVGTLARRYRIFTPYKSIEEIRLSYKLSTKAEDGILLRLEER